MLKITFDKGLPTEASLDLDRISEYPVLRSLVGFRSLIISEREDYIDLTGFVGRTDFRTVEVTDSDGNRLPICNCYAVITDFATNYSAEEKIFSLSITIAASN